MREALIIVIPKPDKDPQHPELYRPISLLVDIQILAKVLAIRLNQVILSLIHPEQTWVYSQVKHIHERHFYSNIQAHHNSVAT